MDSEASGRIILEYFETEKAGQLTDNPTLELPENLVGSTILPESFAEIEANAKEAEDISEESSWAQILRASEKQYLGASIEFFMLGQKDHRRLLHGYSHPRMLLHAFGEAEDSDSAEAFTRSLGLEQPADFDGDSDAEAHEELEAEQMNADFAAEMAEKQSLILRDPMEYFLRSRVMDHLNYIRNRQQNNPNPSGMDRGDFIEWDNIDRYNRRLLEEDIHPSDTYDPLNYQRQAHDLSLIDLKRGLTQAVGDRKAESLPLAVAIFNRI